MNVKQKLWCVILAATLLRCIAAVCLNLGNDEVYYLTYAHHLQWNYFDHPPMVALLIRLTTFNLTFTGEFFVRLGPILLAGINTWLIFFIAKKIKDELAGFIAALLFTASLYCSILAGLFILPDSPQLFFWLLSLLVLLNIIAAAQGKSRSINLLLFGLLAGLCTLSKVHGVFLWLGFGLYIIFYQRSLLGNGYLYLAAVITAITISPILIWNIDNNFITYTFHSERVTISQGLHFDGFITALAGGILYNNPINFVLIILALTGFVKYPAIIAVAQKRLLLLLGLPLIITVLFISLFRDTLAHWSGPGYVSLIILTGCYIAFKAQSKQVAFKKIVVACYAAVILLGVIIISGTIFINYLPGTIGKKNATELGDGDFTLDVYGWQQLATEFKKIHESDIAARKTTTTFIINNKWFPGAHIDNYIARPLGMDFIAIGPLNDIHTYAWLNEYRKKLQPGDDAYFITVSNYFADARPQYASMFKLISKPVIVTQFRSGKPVRNILIYLLKNYTRK